MAMHLCLCMASVSLTYVASTDRKPMQAQNQKSLCGTMPDNSCIPAPVAPSGVIHRWVSLLSFRSRVKVVGVVPRFHLHPV